MPSKKKSDIQIVILQRGWVAVGRFAQSDSDCTLTDAKIIRRWGTTRGIGELIDGPLKNTVLDPAGTLRFHELTIVARLQVDAVAWEKAL